jgi:hypothetical protein
MAFSGGAAGAVGAGAQQTSSYRVKFERREFLALVQLANPRLIYSRKGMHFFAYDGFVMYTDKCKDSDFRQRVLEAIEFSNSSWSK